MKFKNIGKPECQTIRRDLNAILPTALKNMLEQYGLTVEVGGMTYGSTEVSVKLEFKLDSPAALAKYDSILEMLGCPRGSKAHMSGKVFECVGYNPSKPKNDLMIKDVATGKSYSCSSGSFKSFIIK